MPDVDNLHATISRVRRQTRNRDILDICDALERRLVAPATIAAMSKPGKQISKAKVTQKARAK